MIHIKLSGIRTSLFKYVCLLIALLRSPAARRRVPFAVRAGMCCFAPVALGWFLGDLHSGLLGTIGAFTALYGSDRPYRNRAIHLALVAIALGTVVSLGVWVGSHIWLAVSTVAIIAAAATFLCNALRVGPPGAYMFVLACASGTGLAAGDAEPIRTGLIVLCGGLFSWFSHIVGALSDPRAPERSAIWAAGEAVASFVEKAGTSTSSFAQRNAARALDTAWTMLVTWQPVRFKSDAVLEALRDSMLRLDEIFSLTVLSTLEPVAVNESYAHEARAIAQRAKSVSRDAQTRPARKIPLYRPSTITSLNEGLARWSTPLLLGTRAGLATFIAGAIGLSLGLERAYWGMAAVLVVLNQAYGWPGTPRRAVHRVVGTLAGLLLACAILSAHPKGIWIAITVGLLQFAIEIWVVLHYAIAAMFITTIALTTAAGGKGFPDITHLFVARAMETIVGCAVALAVFALTARRPAALQIRYEIARTLSAAHRALRYFSHESVLSADALRARRDLQVQALKLQQVFDNASPFLQRRKDPRRRIKDAFGATERLAYRILKACWQLETSGLSTLQTVATYGDCALARDCLEALEQRVITGKQIRITNEYRGFLIEDFIELKRALDEAV